jgi:UDP-3-O-[3-hydroxymyristoyl] glucosamine N-acyltransferase
MNESVADISRLVGGVVVGDASVRVTGVNGIAGAGPGDLTFLESHRYLSHLATTKAAVVLVPPDVAEASIPLIQVKNPFLAFLKAMRECGYAPEAPRPPAGIHPLAVVDETAVLGDCVTVDAFVRIAPGARVGAGSILYAGVYIGEAAEIGDNSVLYPNVVVREKVKTGKRCIIHSGAVIGGDGFGFVRGDGGTLVKVPQIGTVTLGDDVEVGANSAIDRATFGTTVVGPGTKIDNLCQIGHNVEIGMSCVICGMSGIAGSAKIGNHVTIAAQVGVTDHSEVGDGAVVAARSAVATCIKPGAMVSGYPAIDHKAHMRILGSLRRLPDMLTRVGEFEQRIRKLEEQLHGKAEDCSE